MKKKICKILSLLLVLSLLSGLAACSGSSSGSSRGESDQDNTAAAPVVDPIDDNYRTFYQIFVGSFSDSNNDGIGDIRGIINRMDYLNDGDIGSGQSLGIQGIWLSPIFSSPSYHKYDATDYYSIDWRFGTEDDLRELVELCHERNVKLILDLVLNHTSNQHEWFQSFRQARMDGDTENPYYDFYSCVTTDEKASGTSYQKIAGTDFWYECNFTGDMPELNYDNDDVRQAMLDVARYYLDLGVDGFRFDAIKYIYYGNTAKSVEFWKWYMDELRALAPDIYCLGECWSGENEILEYCSAVNCFNFAMAQAEGTVASAAKGSSISRFTGYMESYQQKVLQADPDGMVIGFLSNHDMDRIAGAFILDSNMRMAANLYLLCCGSPVIYYGEEIGMRGSRGSESTDANRRLAMLWGDDDLIRNPTGSTYPDEKQISSTVAEQLEDDGSLYNYYCRLLAIRHSYPAIARGIYTSLSTGEKNLGGFSIEYQGETWLLLHNTSDEEISLDISALGSGQSFQICDFIGSGSALLDANVLTLGPQTSVILK